MLSQADTTCDVVKSTIELGRTDVELSMTSRLFGGTADCGLGLGIACNAFSQANTALDKVMSTTKLVMCNIESAVIVG